MLYILNFKLKVEKENRKTFIFAIEQSSFVSNGHSCLFSVI